MSVKCPVCRKEATIRLQDPATTDDFQYLCLACGKRWQPYRFSLNQFRDTEWKKYKRVV